MDRIVEVVVEVFSTHATTITHNIVIIAPRVDTRLTNQLEDDVGNVGTSFFAPNGMMTNSVTNI